jgi:hypothetical protein
LVHWFAHGFHLPRSRLSYFLTSHHDVPRWSSDIRI